MFQLSEEKFSNKEHVAIFSKKYDTLRSEIVARSGSVWKVLAVTATLVGAASVFASKQIGDKGQITHPDLALTGAFIGVVVIATILISVRLSRNTGKLGRRVALLEKAINDQPGASLLGWESS